MKVWETTRKRRTPEEQKEYMKRCYSNWIVKLMQRNVLLDAGKYKTLKRFLTSGGISFSEFDDKTRAAIIKKVWWFKFEKSCSNAKYVRCGKKKGYEDVQYLLGSHSDVLRNLRKFRPDLRDEGLIIIEKYIENGFSQDYAPILHRKSDEGHYEWDNIEIMTRKEHDELTRQERKRKKESAASVSN